MAVLDDLEQFVKDNTLDGSWYKPQLRNRCEEFLENADISGGGSSDFHPITVTFSVEGDTPNDSKKIAIDLVDHSTDTINGLYNDTEIGGYVRSYEVTVYAGNTIEIPLIQIGNLPLAALVGQAKEPKSVSGNATVVNKDGNYYVQITGDCTIVAIGGGGK